MFSSFIVETIICSTRKGSYILQNIFLNLLKLFELRIDISRLPHAVIAEGVYIYIYYIYYIYIYIYIKRLYLK